MSSIIAISLLGKLFQKFSLQPFREMYYDDTSVWTEVKSNSFAVAKNYLHSIKWLCFYFQFVLYALVQI